eukprot:356106_1
MGCCVGGCATSPDRLMDMEVSKEINGDRDRAAKIQKLLFLGSGGSGKSTFFKQLKRIHGNGFSNKDRRDYQAQIENQVISQMQKLIIRGRELIEDYGIEKYNNLEIKSDEAKESAAFIELL